MATFEVGETVWLSPVYRSGDGGLDLFTPSIPLLPVHYLPQPILEEMPEETGGKKRESHGSRRKVCFLLAMATAYLCLPKSCPSTLS